MSTLSPKRKKGSSCGRHINININMSKEDEDFKWFGDGFDGFPKSLPEDTVEYVVHVVDPKLSVTETKSRLNDILRSANELKKKYVKDYIWQRDDFNLRLKREDGMWCLRG